MILQVWKRNQQFAAFHIAEQHCPVISLQWDTLGFGLYCSDTDTTDVCWEKLWSFTDGRKMRRSLYNHVNKTGAVWAVRQFAYDYDQLSAVASVASDGSLRAALIPGAIQKSPNETVINVMQILEVGCFTPPSECQEQNTTISDMMEIEGQNDTEIDASFKRPWKLASNQILINRNLSAVDNAQSLDAPSENNGVALHCVDHISLQCRASATKSTETKVDLLVYGGAAGLIGLKGVNFFKVLN